MRALLIDPFAKTVSEVEHAGGLRSIYDHIGCTCIDAVFISEKAVVYVDDNGLYAENQKFFSINGYNLAGKALVVGTTIEGDDADVGYEADKILSVVKWHDSINITPPVLISFVSPLDLADYLQKHIARDDLSDLDDSKR